MASLAGDRLERGLGKRVGLERIRSWVEPRFLWEEMVVGPGTSEGVLWVSV